MMWRPHLFEILPFIIYSERGKISRQTKLRRYVRVMELTMTRSLPTPRALLFLAWTAHRYNALLIKGKSQIMYGMILPI